MNDRFAGAQRLRAQQSGVALIMALIVLTLIMLVGVSSLRQGAVQSKIAFNTNAAGIAFQAADTAVESVIADIVVNSNAENSVMKTLATTPQVSRCVGVVNSVENQTCDALKGPAAVKAYSETTPADVPPRVATGNSTDTVVWRFYEVEGTGSVGETEIAKVTHQQEFAWKEVASGDDIYEEVGALPTENGQP